MISPSHFHSVSLSLWRTEKEEVRVEKSFDAKANYLGSNLNGTGQLLRRAISSSRESAGGERWKDMLVSAITPSSIRVAKGSTDT